ncbi:MAG TPA: family 78 glycoside hydrolase catalytic domain [Spirochaetia bacterium]|nr:family 78 glycoside hydrolase catalytic domain [Spirochaetia bacterium]
MDTLTIESVRFEHLREAVGIGVSSPRLSWIIVTSIGDWHQSAYEIEATASDGPNRGRTGRIESVESVLVPWPFGPLVSREWIAVRVRVWGADGSESGWSDRFELEAGLLSSADWKARFVTPAWEEDASRPEPCAMLRREFMVRSTVMKARLYVTALGLYEAQINGAVVGDQVFSPGWTSYRKRLRYQTFDVTAMLRVGNNAIGAILGDGWYRGRLGYNGGRRNIFGHRVALLAQLEIGYGNGTTELLSTDSSWRAAQGPILASDIYDGETYDARLEKTGWSNPEFGDNDWTPVRPIEHDLSILFAPMSPPVRRMQLITPVAITRSPSGRVLVDFGQNLVGRIRLCVNGQRGQTITIRHAEVLQNGELCVRPLRTANATDRYTLRGGGTEIWEPRFTYHGFRYAEVEGWPGKIESGDILGVVCHSDLERTGWFECSDPLVNQLYENVVWSMRGNFIDVPTDCPQRDERLGWTGDIQIFAPTACFVYDTAGFLASWLADLAADQEENGAVPFFVPNISESPAIPAGAWGDASVIVPWVHYCRYQDFGILAAQFNSMCAWVDQVHRLTGNRLLWDKGFQFGDWLDPATPPERPGDARTDSALVATAYFAHSAELVSRIAGILGREVEETRYAAMAQGVREAFAAEYVSPNGRVVADTATAYSLALQFGLLPEVHQSRRAGARLAQLVRDSGYRISTGFVGTPLLCDALCCAGEHETAFRLLIQQACPSWLYPVTMGATTAWERWDSMLPDGTVNSGDTTSFNHYALGAVADWLHRAVGGLVSDAPGYRRIRFEPLIGGGLNRVRVRHRTPYGIAEGAWSVDDGRIEVELKIPPNTSARVTLPRKGGESIEVGSGTHRWSYVGQQTASPPLSSASSLSELFSDAEAWAAVSSSVPELACLATITQISSATTLKQQLAFLPDGQALLPALEEVLNRLGNRRNAQ